MIVTNIILTAMLSTNGIAIGTQQFEIVPAQGQGATTLRWSHAKDCPRLTHKPSRGGDKARFLAPQHKVENNTTCRLCGGKLEVIQNRYDVVPVRDKAGRPVIRYFGTACPTNAPAAKGGAK